jgi:hypothetical protein
VPAAAAAAPAEELLLVATAFSSPTLTLAIVPGALSAPAPEFVEVADKSEAASALAGTAEVAMLESDLGPVVVNNEEAGAFAWLLAALLPVEPFRFKLTIGFVGGTNAFLFVSAPLGERIPSSRPSRKLRAPDSFANSVSSNLTVAVEAPDVFP